MKVTKTKESKLLKLKLIKTKTYKKHYNLKNLKYEDFLYRLKKSLKIIHKYHINNKNIIFISNSTVFEKKIKKIIKQTKHIFIPQLMWVNLLSNKSKKLQSLNYKYNKEPDLIVILCDKFNNNIIKEYKKKKTPLIIFQNNLTIFKNEISYNVTGEFFTKKKNSNIYLLLTLLKYAIKKH